MRSAPRVLVLALVVVLAVGAAAAVLVSRASGPEGGRQVEQTNAAALQADLSNGGQQVTASLQGCRASSGLRLDSLDNGAASQATNYFRCDMVTAFPSTQGCRVPWAVALFGNGRWKSGFELDRADEARCDPGTDALNDELLITRTGTVGTGRVDRERSQTKTTETSPRETETEAETTPQPETSDPEVDVEEEPQSALDSAIADAENNCGVTELNFGGDRSPAIVAGDGLSCDDLIDIAEAFVERGESPKGWPPAAGCAPGKYICGNGQGESLYIKPIGD